MISPDEKSIVSDWQRIGDEVVGNEQCARIEILIAKHLEKQAESADGWDTLYRDPLDGRLWEHSYAKSGMHGGGPPALHQIDRRIAQDRYGLLGIKSKHLSKSIEDLLGPIHSVLISSNFKPVEMNESFSFGDIAIAYESPASKVRITRDRGQFMVFGAEESSLREAGLTSVFNNASELAEALRSWIRGNAA